MLTLRTKMIALHPRGLRQGIAARRLRGALALWGAASLGVMLLIGGSSHATAGIGGTLMVPDASWSGKRTSGLQLKISTQWVETAGHRPVTVEILAVPAAARDRTLTFELTPNAYSNQREAVRFHVTLPEGSVRASSVVAVPQTMFWQQLNLTTSEDGYVWKELSGVFGIPRTAAVWEWSETWPTMLVIDSDMPRTDAARAALNAQGATTTNLPDLVSLAYYLKPMDENLSALHSLRSQGYNDSQVLSTVDRLSTISLVAPDDIPESRVSYTSVMIVMISYDELSKLVATLPAKWAAIRDHTLSGGTLIVTGCGTNPEIQSEIDRWIDTGSAEASTSSAHSVTTNRASPWRPLARDKYFPTLSDVLNGSVANSQLGEEAIDDVDGRTPLTIPSESPCQRRDAGFGVVVALETDSLGDVPEAHWAWLFNDLSPEHWSWQSRHGFSRLNWNAQYWGLIVPGVGMSPVMPFLAVITLFVLVIGPVNYFLLNRFNRLYLLLVTVPLGALVVTLSLYGYAFLRDGIGTSVTARSFTKLMPDGRAISWSRQSFYSGLPPSQGLVYPHDSVTFPYDLDPSDSQVRRRVTTVERDRIRMTPGYLSARSTCQMVVNHIADDPLSVEIVKDAEQKLQAKNGLGQELKHLLVLDHDRIFWANDVSEGALVELPSIEWASARTRLNEIFNDPDVASTAVTTMPRRSRRRNYYGSMVVTSDALATQGLLNDAITKMMQMLRDESPRDEQCFFAITEKAPRSVPMGVESAEEVRSLHILQGNW